MYREKAIEETKDWHTVIAAQHGKVVNTSKS